MRVAVYLVLFNGDKVLLSRRENTGHKDGMYSMVAGHVDGNESLAAAMVREAKEEADLTVREADLQAVHTIHYTRDIEYIMVFFTAEKWIGEPKNMEPEKCGDLAWFPLDSLPENTIPYIRQAIGHIRNSVPFSEFKE